MGYLSLMELCEGNLEGGGSFTGDSRNMLSKALEMNICFHRGPAFGENGGTLPRAFERGDNFFYLGKFFMRNLRDM